MMRNRFKIRHLAMLALLLALSCTALAERTIGINFCSQYPIPHLEGETADNCSTWTDSVDVDQTGQENGTDRVLIGTNNLVTCSWTSPNTWDAGSEGTSFQQLFRVYLDDGGDGALVTINGLDKWLADENITYYTIRIYHSTDNTEASFSAVDITDGTNILQTVQADNMWATDGGTRAYVDSEALTAASITVDPQPRSGIGTGSQRACIAAIKITGVNIYAPVNPTPAVDDEVPVNQTFTWQQAPAVEGMDITYNVYLGTDPNENNPTYFALNPVKTSTSDSADFFYTPAENLQFSTQYYWRVDAIVPNGGEGDIQTGTLWSFTTEPDTARIESQTSSMTVDSGIDLDLTVNGINITTYQWFKDGMALDDDTTDTLYIGENDATLTLLDVQKDDEAVYHCVADNSLNIPAESDPIRITTKRMVANWTFDDTLVDTVDGWTGVYLDPNENNPAPEVVYDDDAISGKSIRFAKDDLYVEIQDSADFFNFYPQGYTTCAWIKTNDRGAVISKEISGWTNGWALTDNGGNATHTLRQYGDLHDGSKIDNDQWHFLAITLEPGYDPENPDAKLLKTYVDGLQTIERTYTGDIPTSTASLMIGMQTDTLVYPWNGLIDELSMWTYPLTHREIAQMYVNVTKEDLCIGNPEFDFNGNCIVDLYDFMIFAQNWMDCNLVPTCD